MSVAVLARRPSLAAWGFMLLLAVLAPLYILGKFPTLEWSYVFAFLIAIAGLNLLTGYCGQISLGNSAFMAIGGYTTAILTVTEHWNYLLTLPIAAVLAAGGGVLLGIPALKLRGLYLGLATFALAISMPTVIRHFESFSGGSQGISLPPAVDPLGLVDSGQLTTEQWLYYLSLVLAVALFMVARQVLRSDVGRSFKAIRDGETAAVASGVSLRYYKTLAFGLSAFYAGVAGSLVVIDTEYINPDSFDVTLSLALVVGAVIGGLGTQIGPILGAIFTAWVPIYAYALFKAKPDIAYGIFLIALMYTMPSGIAGGLMRIWGWYRRQRAASRRAGAPEEVVPVKPEEVASPAEAPPA